MRIFDRPDLDQRGARLAMYITGSFANGKPSEAYEGRLQVHNGVGGLTVEQIDGDKLPNGASLYMDGSEVVVSWPAYAEASAVIPNPGFELGDTAWLKGPGWSIGTDGPIVGSQSARYGETQGDSLIENTARYPVNPGVPITATCQVRQGASAAGNAGAAVQLQWRREDGTLLGTSEGNAVMSASKNRVYPSTITAVPIAGAALVNVASRGIRRRENKPLFIDSFVWDLLQITGINIEKVLAVTLRIRDSSGQSVLWSGTIAVIDVRDYAVEVMDDTPVAYWKLDDLLGVTSFADSSGNSITAQTIRTWAGGATEPLMQRGALRTGGQSGYFDGISNIGVAQGDNGFSKLAVSADGEFALECVIETPTFLGTSTPYILRKQAEAGTAHYDDYLLGFSGNQTFRLVFGWTNNGTGSARHLEAPMALEPGKIYHVMGVSEVIDGVVTASLYINGVLVAMRDDSIMQSLPIDSGGVFTVNAPQNWGAWSFQGRISDIAIYDHPVSAARVLRHARAAGLFEG